MNETDSLRNRFKELLQLLASKEEQLKYQNNVPIADVPAELVCMWFDDLYPPDMDLFDKSFNENEKKNIGRVQ